METNPSNSPKSAKTSTRAGNYFISNYPPFSFWSEDQKLAFWINAYNAVAASLVVERYPTISSIKDIEGIFDEITSPIATDVSAAPSSFSTNSWYSGLLYAPVIMITRAVIVQMMTVSMNGPSSATIPSRAGYFVFAAA